MTPTPLLEITALGFPNGNRVFAKCENHNPISHSHYDRVYEYLFDKSLQRREIKAGKTLLFETSSGNAGTAFARFCELHGFEGVVIFPKEVRESRVEATAARNVRVEISTYDGYMKGALRRMLELARQAKQEGRQVFIMNHSHRWDSVVALGHCGNEIVQDFRRIDSEPNYFISALGNGTSTTGIGTRLKQQFSNVRIIGFEPSRSPVFTNRNSETGAFPFSASSITGTGVWGIPFPNMNLGLLDRIELIDENGASIQRWTEIGQRVAEQFNESIGLTSRVAIDLAKRLCLSTTQQNILVVFYDTAEFY